MSVDLVLPVGGPSQELISAGGRRQWRDVPSRNLLDVIDVVAADHTAVVKQAYLDYPYWHLPPATRLRVNYGYGGIIGGFARTCIVIPQGGSLVGQDPLTSVIQLLADYPGGTLEDQARTVFLLDGPLPAQAIRNLTVRGTGPTPMTHVDGQSAIFYENDGRAGLQSVIRSAAVTFENVSFERISSFSIHSEQARIHTIGGNWTDVANGWNVNGSNCLLAYANMLRSEGVESSGIGTRVLHTSMKDVLGIAVSIGGYFTVNRPEYHSSLIDGLHVYGTLTATGGGIIVAESMSAVRIANVYLQGLYYGIQAADMGAYLSNGVSIANADIVGCRDGIILGQDNASVRGARIEPRADLTAYVQNFGVSVQPGADNVSLDGVSVAGGAYAFDLAGTNIGWGPTNRGTGFANGEYQIGAAATFVDAAHLGHDRRAVGGATNMTQADRYLTLGGGGAGRTLSLVSAAGKPGRRVWVKRDDAFAHIIDASGTETIDGALTKTLGSQFAAIELVSDGSNWLILSQMGTVT